MQSVLNWGIIGLGNAAKNFATGFADSKNSKLIAVASKNKEKLNYFQKTYNLEDKQCYNSYEEILEKDVIKLKSKIDNLKDMSITKIWELELKELLIEWNNHKQTIEDDYLNDLKGETIGGKGPKKSVQKKK